MFEQSLRSKSFTTQFWAQFQLKKRLTTRLSRVYAQRVSKHNFEYKFSTQKRPHTFFWVQVFNSKRASHILLSTSFQLREGLTHFLLSTSFQLKKSLTHSLEYKFSTQRGPHTFSFEYKFSTQKEPHILLSTSFQFKKSLTHSPEYNSFNSEPPKEHKYLEYKSKLKIVSQTHQTSSLSTIVSTQKTFHFLEHIASKHISP